VTVTPLSLGTHIHISFNYFCCYAAADRAAIKAVLAAHSWAPLNVTFDRVRAFFCLFLSFFLSFASCWLLGYIAPCFFFNVFRGTRNVLITQQ
jgi:hypothetical protein